MGLFSRKKRGAEPEVKVELRFPPDHDELMRDMKERERLADEGRQIRKERIAAAGVDVSMFTPEKVKRDALGFLDEFAPSYRRLNVDTKDARISGDFQNLTKTGKLPKNVYQGSIDVPDPRYPASTDNVIVHLKYLADGAVNMADLHLWHDGVRHGMSIRTVEGEYRITSITTTDMRRDLETTLYLDNKPQGNEEALSVFAEAMEELLR